MNTRKKVRSVRTVSVNAELKAELEARAHSMGFTLSQLVDEILRKEMRRYDTCVYATSPMPPTGGRHRKVESSASAPLATSPTFAPIPNLRCEVPGADFSPQWPQATSS